MKVYDCFIFNDELDLLELRLRFLNDVVDYFVLVESNRTISGERKILFFESNKNLFKPYLDKIIHLIAPANDSNEWDYEFFQRNYIKNGLSNCKNSDIILISDIDEIVNLKKILILPNLTLPVLIELPMFNYFFNVELKITWRKNLLATWDFLRDKDIGDRFHKYPLLTEHVITKHETSTGWHFSYVFGYEIEKYQKKIKDFTHQEYNTDYFLNPVRIKQCITTGIDLYERSDMSLTLNNEYMKPILPFIEELDLTRLIVSKPWPKYSSIKSYLFVFKKKYLRQLKNKWKKLFLF